MTLSRCRGQRLPCALRGTLACYAVPGNSDAVSTFRYQVTMLWHGAPAPKPAEPDHLGRDKPVRDSVDNSGADHASLPGSAPCCQDLRQEPRAVVLHAGFCAGASREGDYRDKDGSRLADASCWTAH